MRAHTCRPTRPSQGRERLDHPSSSVSPPAVNRRVVAEDVGQHPQQHPGPYRGGWPPPHDRRRRPRAELAQGRERVAQLGGQDKRDGDGKGSEGPGFQAGFGMAHATRTPGSKVMGSYPPQGGGNLTYHRIDSHQRPWPAGGPRQGPPPFSTSSVQRMTWSTRLVRRSRPHEPMAAAQVHGPQQVAAVLRQLPGERAGCRRPGPTRAFSWTARASSS